MDGWMDGWMEGGRDGWMDEQNQRQQGREERIRCCTEVGVKQLISFWRLQSGETILAGE